MHRCLNLATLHPHLFYTSPSAHPPPTHPNYHHQLETDTETAEWLNLIMARFWLIVEPVLRDMIPATVNPILEYYTPNFIVIVVS